jgi:diguanylate cyclase (GGDEF)-like protein
VLIVDVDSFRIVNAAAGQAVGDALLAAAAERLASCAAEQLVARTGDNEFTILAAAVPPEATLTMAASVLAAFHEPFDIGGREVHVTASIGIADLARDGDGADFLLRGAAAALRRAKELGGNQRQHSSSALTLAEFERVDVEQRMRRAIATGELSLVYQPQVRLAGGALIGLEALLRWNRDGRTIPAAEFIRAIEHSAIIIDLGEWVIGETCRQIAEWRRAGLPVPRIAVNIGARHFQHPRLIETIRTLLAEHGVDGSALEIEITETTAMHDAEATGRTIDEVRALGLEITIDDFGTGYSSLAYLKRFAITGLKIDRSFVADLPASRSATAIVNAIVATARALDLRVVAEGVETREQADFLTASQCSEAQGYLFAVPIPAKDIPAYLNNTLQDRKETTHAS